MADGRDSGKGTSGKEMPDDKIFNNRAAKGNDCKYSSEVASTKKNSWIFGWKKNGNEKIRNLSFFTKKNENDCEYKSLQHSRAEEIRRTIGIDGDSLLLVDALNQLLTLASRPGPALIVGHHGVGKKKFAEFFHRMVGGESHNFHILHCKEFASLPRNLTRYIKSFDADQLRTIAFNHAELLERETLHRMEVLFFPPLLCKIRPIFIVGLQSFMHFFSQLSPQMRKFLQDSTVTVPSLQERPEDLQRHILSHLSKLNHINGCIKRISSNSLKILLSCHYDENFHSLFSLIEALYGNSKGIIECNETLIQMELRRIEIREILPEFGEAFQLEDHLLKLRSRIVDKAMAQANGNLSTASRLLGIDVGELGKFTQAKKE
ncbi:MAG: sigma 54-interacting transcriptional regulator [Puniceicoccales bacterium]|jgi:transcriptional regulator with PAS, ATPase and Fis domain|nr:sigma 54-interacting transcriptional regulator [Puniceicoccales bacterium]